MKDENDPIFLVKGFAQGHAQATGKICQILRLVLEDAAEKEQASWADQIRQSGG